MRILLDSRDLIDLAEHGRPTTIREFETYLRQGNHENVLSFTNIRELAGPLAAGGEFLQIRPILQELERVPHTYIREITIVGEEIRSAVNSFENGAEYQSAEVYTDRWDRTLMPVPGQQESPADNWVNLRLDEIVYYIYLGRQEVFAPPQRHLSRWQALLVEDRARLRAGEAPSRQHFINALKRHANSHHVDLPNGREDQFAEWVYENPDRCPGLRLHHETYRAVMANVTDTPEAADFSDLAHVFAVPYVQAATLDRRMRHYCRVASRELVRLGCASNYSDRIHQDLGSVMQRMP